MSNDNNRKATQIDAGWRSGDSKSIRNATQVDAGWREQSESGRRVTEVDIGWRANNTSNARQATQVDAGWRQEIEDTLGLTSVMKNATANYFAEIEDFKDAIEKLQELKSSAGNVYPVKRTISREGGESIILLCAGPDGNDVVAKVYYEPVNAAGSSIASRSQVLEYMRTEEGKRYTLAVTEIGLVEFGESKYYFEIMPYCASRDLSDDGAYSFDQLVEITRQLNEAFHSIHQAGIVHRDIKPENLYKFDGKIKIGDFGIARTGVEGGSGVTETVQGTREYMAPETVTIGYYRYNIKSDYYSLGVTLATLFEGHSIYKNMEDDRKIDRKMQALFRESGRLPLMRVDPNREQLENLLNGLCRYDLKQRFGYEEVNLWLADHNYTGGGMEEEWPKAYRLLDDSYRDEKSMFYGITRDEQHWEEAKEMLYEKYIENFFKSFRTDLARSAQIADELYRVDNRDKGLSIFLKNLFTPGPIVWKGHTFNSLEELGNKMVTTKTFDVYSQLLQNRCISHWLRYTEGISADDDTIKLVDSMEALSVTEPEVACYWFGNAFAPERTLEICNRTVTSIAELIEALFDSPNDFYQTDGYQKLMNRVDGADLYGFLYSFGYKEFVDLEWEHLASCDTFNKIAILLSMLDNIAVEANVDSVPIRNFFVQYGPIGLATYTKKLVEGRIYRALDSDGKQVLDRILSFKAPATGSVNELFRAYSPLVDRVDKLCHNLIENPHCILTGIYESKGIICTNLMGCFAFKIFDRVAPLGFHTWIETANGGEK